MNTPNRFQGPQADTLAEAAAAVSEQLGVPRFGANVLAASYPLAGPEHRSTHLLHTLELYLAADDDAHADAVAEFAQNRLSATELSSAGWREALRTNAAEKARAADRAHIATISMQAENAIAEALRLKSVTKRTPEAAP
jgi:hypothetical protein